MVQRRSRDRDTAEHDWRRFLERNAETIQAAGMPMRVLARISDWDDLLVLGHAAGEPGGFSIAELDESQYAALVQLVFSYFAAGYEFYEPLALRAEDRDALRARFGDNRASES